MAWNQPTPELSKQKRTRKSSKSVLTMCLVPFLVALLVLCSILFLNKPEAETDSSEEKTVRYAKDVSKPIPSMVTPIKKIEPPKELPYWERDTTNGLTHRQLMKWKIHHRPPAAITNRTSQTELPPAYAIFEARSENSIAALLTVPPGSSAVGDPEYERWFTKDFLKSLEAPIIVSEDDTPEQAQLKRDMIATKIELKARYDAGEDIAKIMSDTRKELQQLSVYRSEIETVFREAINKPGITEKEIDDFIESANIMLENKGVAPIKLGPLAKRRLVRKANGY